MFRFVNFRLILPLMIGLTAICLSLFTLSIQTDQTAMAFQGEPTGAPGPIGPATPHPSPLPPFPTPTPTPPEASDTNPPVTTARLEGIFGQNNWYVSPVTITLVATDDWAGVLATAYLLDDKEKEIYSVPIVVTVEQSHALQFYSIDKIAYNLEEPQRVGFKIDITPPTVTHILTGTRRPNGWYNPPVTITFSGLDVLSGLDHYEVNLNNTGWFTATTISYTVTVTGYHRLAYRGVDRAGNVSPIQTAAFGIGQPKSVYLPFILKLR